MRRLFVALVTLLAFSLPALAAPQCDAPYASSFAKLQGSSMRVLASFDGASRTTNVVDQLGLTEKSATVTAYDWHGMPPWPGTKSASQPTISVALLQDGASRCLLFSSVNGDNQQVWLANTAGELLHSAVIKNGTVQPANNDLYRTQFRAVRDQLAFLATTRFANAPKYGWVNWVPLTRALIESHHSAK